MIFILVTNVISEIRKIRLGRADPNLARWADSVKAGHLPSPRHYSRT